MSLTEAELQYIGPRLASWLTHVFRVMGGYVAATGVLALTLALTVFRRAIFGRRLTPAEHPASE